MRISFSVFLVVFGMFFLGLSQQSFASDPDLVQFLREASPQMNISVCHRGQSISWAAHSTDPEYPANPRYQQFSYGCWVSCGDDGSCFRRYCTRTYMAKEDGSFPVPQMRNSCPNPDYDQILIDNYPNHSNDPDADTDDDADNEDEDQGTQR